MTAPLPDQLKQIKPYITLATQLEQKNEKAVAYYCRFFALQQGMSINKSLPECKKYLGQLMDLVENSKSQNKNDESIQSQIVGQAKCEEFALNLFTKADEDDRSANFHKNLVKSFYSAGLLFDVLQVFGDLSEDLVAKKQYSKYKAMYLNKCFQNGETPIAGPIVSDEDNNEEINRNEPVLPKQDQSNSNYGFTNVSPSKPAATNNESLSPNRPKSSNYSNLPDNKPAAAASYNQEPSASNASSTTIRPELMAKAQKHCKYATSALNYDDVDTAITNLEECLRILKTGK